MTGLAERLERTVEELVWISAVRLDVIAVQGR